MLKKSLMIAAMIGSIFGAQAAVQPLGSTTLGFTGSVPNGGVIPDASLTGWGSTITASGFSSEAKVVDITVTLNLSGGYNGDLYAYISSGDQKAILLNRVGRGEVGISRTGYGDSGMSITFSDDAAGNIHSYKQDPDWATKINGGTWQPDGRDIAPGASLSTFQNASINKQLSVFKNTVLGNGDWTLFIADVSGGNQSVLSSWSLSITAIPEPIHIALGFFGGLFGLVGLWRSKWTARWFKKS